MNRKRLFTGLLVLAGMLAISPAAQLQSSQTTSGAALQAPVTIPFKLVGRHIVLGVKVDGKRPFSFVLDTGDKYAIVDLGRARELGLQLEGEIRMHGAGLETPTGSYVRNSSFSVIGLPDFSQPVNLALPIGRLAAKMGQDFDGIIGHDFIRNFVVEIDYQARQLKLHDKGKFSYSGPGESVPIKIDYAGHPILEAEVTPVGGEPIRGKFVVDIGSGLALAIHSPIVTSHKLLGGNLKTIKSLGAAGAGGSVAGQLGRIAQLKIGSFKISEPIAMFAEDKRGAFANEALVGNIGAQVMNRFRVFLDYERNRIILEPNSDFGKPYDRAFSGLSLQAEGSDYRIFRVVAVLENSPGAETGLLKDDIISSVDGRPATALTLSKLNEMFERAGDYKLSVRRGDQTLQLTLKPRRLV